MGRVQPSAGKQTANYLAAVTLALVVFAWLAFLGWGAWSIIGFILS